MLVTLFVLYPGLQKYAIMPSGSLWTCTEVHCQPTGAPMSIGFEHIGSHELVFVTMTGDKFTPHHLKDLLPEDSELVSVDK